MAVTYHLDFESYGTDDFRWDDPYRTGGPLVVEEVNTPDPYAGLNRAQRRKAMSVENRAWKKRAKEANRRG